MELKLNGPCSMRSRITQTGSTWVWLSFFVALALTLPLIWCAWAIIGPNTYEGGDGKGWQSLIRAFIEFAPPFHVNILNPLQGAAEFGNPINVWVDPVTGRSSQTICCSQRKPPR
jgi:hypothetical protein